MIIMAVGEHDLVDVAPVLLNSGRKYPCIHQHISEEIGIPEKPSARYPPDRHGRINLVRTPNVCYAQPHP
jgi:hypothetical protein